MPDFKPYTLVEESKTRLLIKEPLWRQRIYFFVFRIVPFFFLVQALVIIVMTKDEAELPAAALPAILLFTFVPGIILFTRKYIVGIDINTLAFELIRKTFRGKENITYAIADIDSIQCKKRSGKGAGYFYYIKFKSGKRRERFMTIPRFQMTEEKRRLISEKVKNVTGLNVQHT